MSDTNSFLPGGIGRLGVGGGSFGFFVLLGVGVGGVGCYGDGPVFPRRNIPQTLNAP